MATVESFIGGFAGGFLEVGFHIGYGLYFTTTRLIGVDLASPAAQGLRGIMAGLVKGELMPRLSPEENAQTIAWLDSMKAFAIGKPEIRQVELKRPGLGTGHMTVVPNVGAPLVIKLRHATAYDRLVQLMQAFAPELVRGG